MIENIAYITKKMQNLISKNYSIKGNLNNLSQEDVDNLIPLLSATEEGYNSNAKPISGKEDYQKNIGNNITIQIYTGNIKGYYDKLSSFIIKNKIKPPQESFYIREIDFLSIKDSQDNNIIIKNYFENIELISLLSKIADYKKETGDDLELFFYKAEQGLALKIDYDKNNLENLNIGILHELTNHFDEKPDKEERKKIFINDLISLLSNDSSYSYLLERWNTLQSNYDKSFKFYLSGFSFEKIKTSSVSYFQELTDRIYNQINKATTNIFIVPTAYMFFLRSFSSSNSIIQNILLLITAFIFSFVMHRIIFKNMNEGLNTIKKDIKAFKEKADSNLLKDIQQNFDDLEGEIKKQEKKIAILKWSTWILFSFSFAMFLCSHLTFFICQPNWVFNKKL